MNSEVSLLEKRFTWLIILFLISLVLSLLGPYFLSVYVRADLDFSQFYARLGSDALTLAGFILTSLAIIAKQIDRRIFDSVRLDEGFRDMWRVFALTAIVFCSLAIVTRATELFPVLESLAALIVFLFLFGISLLLFCIFILYRVVDLINEDRIKELQQKANTPTDI